MRLAVPLILTLLSGCSVSLNLDQTTNRTGSLSPNERNALYQEARKAAQQSRKRYIATEGPALQRTFRREYPTMTEAEIDALVNEALEKELRAETEHRLPGPGKPPPLDCMSSPWRNSVFTNCY